MNTQTATVKAADEYTAFLCGKCFSVNMEWKETIETIWSKNPNSSVPVRDKITKICPVCGHKETHSVSINSVGGVF